MVEICGRRVKIRTGTKSQTVSICDIENLEGRYECIVRLPPPFVSASVLLGKKVSSIQDLIAYLERHHSGQIEQRSGTRRSASLPRELINRHSLVALFQSARVNRLRDLAATAAELSEDQLHCLFEQQKQTAPRRESRSYFVGHTGRTTSGNETNRREEHLAIALWSAYRRSGLPLPDGTILFPLDYQLPLKASRDKANLGVGKVDLFCVDAGGEPWVAELKVPSAETSRADSPLKALLEALAYCAILDPNMEKLSHESIEVMGEMGDLLHAVRPIRPNLLILAPSEYWDALDNARSDYLWRDPVLALSHRIELALKIRVRLVRMDNCQWEMPTSGYPRLVKHPNFNWVSKVPNPTSRSPQ